MTRETHATGFLWGARAVVRAALAHRFPERLGGQSGRKLSFPHGNLPVSDTGSVFDKSETDRIGIKRGD